MFTKTLVVIVATALVGANAATLDAVGSTCECTPLDATTSIIADLSTVFVPTGCTFKGVEGTSYACTFASATEKLATPPPFASGCHIEHGRWVCDGPAGAKESVSLAGFCRWYPGGYYDCIKY